MLKLFLYKLTILNRKQAYEREQLLSAVQARQQTMERESKSALEEVNQFLQTVHSDFELFLKKHKREHADLALKLSSLTDSSLQTQLSTKELQVTIETMATMVACMLEFCNVDYALSYQDEQDRNNIALTGHKAMLKGDAINKTVGGMMTMDNES